MSGGGRSGLAPIRTIKKRYIGTDGSASRAVQRADLLITYLEGRQLSAAQMAALLAEKEPGATREELLAGMDNAFHRAELVIRAIDPARLPELREVGRKRLPTTVAGLLVHIAEHTQRHVGQAISAAKLAQVRK
jgi:uncharacterized damage-inducible protein DinB